MSPLLMLPLHPKHNGSEKHKQANHHGIQDPIHGPLQPTVLPRQRPRHPVEHEPRGQDRKVECRVIVVHVGDARHGHEGEVMQEPAGHGVQASVMDVIDFTGLEFVVAALPADQIPADQSAEYEQGEGGTPVDGRVAQEEVFDDVVVPATHAEADVQDGPLPELRGQVVLLVWVGHEGIVGGHHGDVEVDEVAEEWRLVAARVTGRYCTSLATEFVDIMRNYVNLHRSFQWASTFQ